MDIDNEGAEDEERYWVFQDGETIGKYSGPSPRDVAVKAAKRVLEPLRERYRREEAEDDVDMDAELALLEFGGDRVHVYEVEVRETVEEAASRLDTYRGVAVDAKKKAFQALDRYLDGKRQE